MKCDPCSDEHDLVLLQEMFKHAVRHHKKPAKTDILNKQHLTPLTLAGKLGRANVFKDMLDLGSIVSGTDFTIFVFSLFREPPNLLQVKQNFFDTDSEK